MQILLTNHKLRELGGSETWTKTMYDELAKEHRVDVFTPNPNRLYPDMPRFQPGREYELVLQNHNSTFRKRLDTFEKVVFTSHGIIPKVERPVLWADQQVAVSEEVRDFDGLDATVIRNPINTEVFKPTRKLRDRPQNILFISNNQKHAVNVVRQACAGMTVQVLGLGRRRHDVQEMINWADLVISLGRGCYEALACGRNVVVYDVHGGDGFVTPENLLDFRKNNCSGRYNKFQYKPAQLRAEIEKYDPSLSADLRTYALEHHDVSKIAQQYLDLP